MCTWCASSRWQAVTGHEEKCECGHFEQSRGGDADDPVACSGSYIMEEGTFERHLETLADSTEWEGHFWWGGYFHWVEDRKWVVSPETRINYNWTKMQGLCIWVERQIGAILQGLWKWRPSWCVLGVWEGPGVHGWASGRRNVRVCMLSVFTLFLVRSRWVCVALWWAGSSQLQGDLVPWLRW